VVDPRNKSVAEALSDLLREIGISRTDDTLSVANLTLSSAAGAGEETLALCWYCCLCAVVGVSVGAWDTTETASNADCPIVTLLYPVRGLL
jgi:hypothetical protein